MQFLAAYKIRSNSNDTCMQVVQDPRWQSFSLATDVVAPRHFLPYQVRGILKRSPILAKSLGRDRRQHEQARVRVEVIQLYRNQHALCLALATQMIENVQVS
jgi:hypothetical protein